MNKNYHYHYHCIEKKIAGRTDLTSYSAWNDSSHKCQLTHTNTLLKHKCTWFIRHGSHNRAGLISRSRWSLPAWRRGQECGGMFCNDTLPCGWVECSYMCVCLYNVHYTPATTLHTCHYTAPATTIYLSVHYTMPRIKIRPVPRMAIVQ